MIIMNKKGFTLVELLATIVIIALLSGIAAISYTTILEKSRLKSFHTYENTMYAEVMKLIVDSLYNPGQVSLFPRNGETKKFYLSELVANKEIETFNNPVNKDDLCYNSNHELDSYVEVTRNDYISSKEHVDALEYKVCLICPNSNYNVLGANCFYAPSTPNP